MGGRGIQILATGEYPARGFEIRDNRIEDCWDRGLLIAEDQVRAFRNIITDTSVAGIAIEDPAFPTGEVWIHRNSVSRMRGEAPAVDLADPAARVSMTLNHIAESEVGVRCRPGAVDVSENVFREVTFPVRHILN